LFLSRDPVDIIEMEPESANPYQFAYNNPYVYSDPTGMITILELNARDSMQNVLNGIKTHTMQGIKEELISRGQQLAADAFFSAIETFVPINFSNVNFSAPSSLRVQNILSNQPNVAGVAFEVILKSAFCEFLPEQLHQKIFFEADINAKGDATYPGYQCPQILSRRVAAGVSRPDFIVTPDRPRSSSRAQKRSYLIGDIKLSLTTVVDDYFGGPARSNSGRKRNQWDAMVRYAKNHGTRILAFPTLFAGQRDQRSDLRNKVVKEAAEDGVIVFTVSAQ
jgi:hypothetical protein